jgi:Ca2+:H+ antiporter
LAEGAPRLAAVHGDQTCRGVSRIHPDLSGREDDMIEKLLRLVREEWFLGVSMATSAIVIVFGALLEDRLSTPSGLVVRFLWLFAVVLGSCMSVVRHADHLAVRLGEPYGTIILTLAVTIVEVISISAISVHGERNPALVRDTIFAVVMILLNGMIGLSLLLGGWRHREQGYNLQGANTYLGLIIPITVLSLILPNFTMTTPGPSLSLAQECFVIFISVALYAAFLAIQTTRHRVYFTFDEPAESADNAHGKTGYTTTHALLLIAYMAPLVFLAEKLAHPVDALLDALHAPAALGGCIIALLVVAPEAVSAIHAAAANRLQRSLNIFMGSVLATIGLTIPAMTALSQVTGDKIILGLENASAVVLVLTLAVSVVTFSSGRTNVLQGAVHLVLFGAYVLLLFQG